MISQISLLVLLLQAEFTYKQAKVMICIAKNESHFRLNLINTNTNGSKDYGLFQINDKWWIDHERGCGYDRDEILDVINNISCAKIIYDRRGFKPWYGYKKECDNYKLDWETL